MNDLANLNSEPQLARIMAMMTPMTICLIFMA